MWGFAPAVTLALSDCADFWTIPLTIQPTKQLPPLSTPQATAGLLVGTIIAYAGISKATPWASNFWLLCDGRPLDSTSNDYSNLFEAIGTQYGSSGVYFNLPDLRGMFLRGVGKGSANDPDLATRYLQGDPMKTPIPSDADPVGSVQDDVFASHIHGTNASSCAFKGPGQDFTTGGDADYTSASIQETGGHETRPKNVAVYYLIYAGPPVDSGNQTGGAHA